MPTCWHCKAETSKDHWLRIAENKLWLYGPWDGWRMSGRFLIAPGRAGKISPERLLGMLWEERSRRGKLKAEARPTPRLLLLPPRERFEGSA